MFTKLHIFPTTEAARSQYVWSGGLWSPSPGGCRPFPSSLGGGHSSSLHSLPCTSHQGTVESVFRGVASGGAGETLAPPIIPPMSLRAATCMRAMLQQMYVQPISLKCLLCDVCAGVQACPTSLVLLATPLFTSETN